MNTVGDLMKINKSSNNYLRTEKTSNVYETKDGVEAERKLIISGSDDRVKSEAGWLSRLLP